ncbi:hypothetical protein J2Y58_003612 [Sphingomonas sp. BE138]|uniref:hypothetical protein n=1 Tax=Sphingomonas sp. BE138 TaxID=2817845 RepID=UPI00286184B9|nr:hypothetical protein [Sphingomonas sp. BE138]MDR6790232.1 hypothetical protein [Sphingomonas sp. BE138]
MTGRRTDNFPHPSALVKGDKHPERQRYRKAASRPRLRSFYITRFFEECELEYAHDGSSRVPWTEGVLAELLADAHPSTHQLPERFATVLRTLIVGACNCSGLCSQTVEFSAQIG